MPNAHKIVVLVAEDDPFVREVIISDLEDIGFEVLGAGNAAAALAILRTKIQVDVLFTDIRMPGKLDGWDLAERAREERPDLPVIYASGFVPSEARQVDGSVFISKPYRAFQVQKAVEKLVTIK